MVEGDDVAQSVFQSCFRAVQEGRVPDLTSRDNLWALLVKITDRKASKTNRCMSADKRGGGKVSGESVFLSCSNSFSPGIAGIAGDQPTPEFVAIFTEEVQNRLDSLPEDARKVVSLIMEGDKQKEIATKTGFSIAKVEQKRALVRDKWGQDSSDESENSH